MNQELGYLIFDKCEQRYLSRNGIGFGWSRFKIKAAILTQEQAGYWITQLVRIKERGGFSVLTVSGGKA